MTEKKKTRGRPKLPKGHVKSKYVPVRLNDEDLKHFTKAAKKDGHKTLSGWIRHTLREAIER
jgi:uncharacterized NAD(P)/FAD-binding protein YdhS